MKLQSKKLISLILAVVLVLGIFPMAGFAVGEDSGQEPVLAQELETPGTLTTDNPSSPSSLPVETPSTLPPETPAEQTPSTLPEETATPTPTPTPTPAPAAVDVSALSGQELYAYLLTLEGDALNAALINLTEQQCASLEGIPDEATLSQWAALVGTDADAPFVLDSNFSGSVGSVLGSVTTAGSKRSLMAGRSATVLAVTEPTLPTPTSNPNLITSKKAAANSDGTYNITITAYTASNIVISPIPCDIVMVLDRSGSMGDNTTSYTYKKNNKPDSDGTYFIYRNGGYTSVTYGTYSGNWYYGTWPNNTYIESKANGTGVDSDGDGLPEYQFYTRAQTTQTKLAALKTAAKNYVDTVNSISPQSRIAVVTYAGSASYPTNAFLTVNSNVTTLKNAIDGMSDGGSTRADLAMNQAKSAFDGDNNPPAGTRSKVVILFTDGVPTSSDTFNETVANTAISTANTLKKASYNATIYTVGFFTGNETSDFRVGRFMSYTSSNYAGRDTALTVSDNVSPDNGTKYYIYTNDSSALNDIFQSIGNETGQTITGATVKDVITRQFELTDESRAAILAIPGTTITTDTYGRVIITWPHDFTPVQMNDSNPVTTDPGYFSFTFTVQRKPGYIGGNTAYSNYSDSGVYTGTTPIENFDMPTLNATIKYDGFVESRNNIYMGDSVDIATFFSEAKYSIGGVEYEIDGVYNKYVKIVYTLKQGSTALGTYTILPGATTGTWAGNGSYAGGTITGLTADTRFDIEVAITRIDSGAAPAVGTVATNKLINDAVTVSVYKPVISVQNLAVYLTNSPDLNSAVAGVVWEHNGTEADTDEMGPNPALTYTFTYTSPVTDYLTGDTGVNITGVKRTVSNYVIAATNYTVHNAAGVDTTPDFTVYVYKPVVTATDAEVFLGDTTDLSGRYSHDIDTGWYATLGAPAKPATAPNLTLTPALVRGTALPSDITAYAPIMESDFTVNVVANGKTITDKTKFITAEYSGGVIGIPTKDVNGNGVDHHFTIRVKTGTLTITKRIPDSADTPKSGESFLFTITVNKGSSSYTFNEVISARDLVNGVGSKVITGLPKGTYTVTEDTNWSWRYNNKTGPTWTDTILDDQKLGETNEDTSIACTVTNSSRTPFWLSWETYAPNLFE